MALEDDINAALASAGETLHSAGITQSPHLCYTVVDVANEAWVEQIKASYVPLQVADGLYIVPEWSKPVDPNAINIILQPGVAFGTGEHPTTRLCLLALKKLDLAGRTLIDYGAGSGVLALAALKFGATAAVGTDTDELAVRSARRNATLNAVGNKFCVLQCGASLTSPEPLSASGMPPGLTFDVVVANILRGPLVELCPRLCAYAAPGACLLLSGILTEQAPEIVAAYTHAFEDFSVESDGSWACIQATRRKDA